MSFLYDDEMYGGNSDAVVADLQEGISVAFEGGNNEGPIDMPVWSGSIFSGTGSKPGEDSMAQAASQQPRSLSGAADEKAQGGGILSRIGSFAEKNKSLSEMIGRGLQGAFVESARQKAARVLAQSQMDQLKMKNQLEQENNARTSASVTGLNQPGGIIHRGQLKRTDGTNVFTNGRIV